MPQQYEKRILKILTSACIQSIILLNHMNKQASKQTNKPLQYRERANIENKRKRNTYSDVTAAAAVFSLSTR